MMSSQWILLVIIAANLVYCNENEIKDTTPIVYEPSWVYKCMGTDGCQRSDRPRSLVEDASSYYDSLALCRTVCGRFGGLWPKPVSAVLSMQTVKMHPNNLRYDLSNVPAEAREMIAQMTQVTSSNLMAECAGNVTDLVDTRVVVYLTVRGNNLELTWDTNEEYFLDVQMKDGGVAVRIDADNVYGARHALETFSQLVTTDKPDQSHQPQCGLRVIIGAKIRDKPAYRHRGLVLDTSRHFIPMKDIKRMIDGMASTKLNVFHWHVTDSHSFPLESTRVPQFTRYGAYSSSDIYSVEEVRQLIKYAQIRGVRVVIEIDAPAHAGNGWQWGKDYGFGDLAVCVNAEPWRRLCIEPPCGQLNPANPVMYRVLRNLYKDIAELLPKPAVLHVGGDEVFFGCWNSSEAIVNYMEEKGIERTVDGFIKLWGEFHTNALQAWDEELKSLGTDEPQPVMIWSSELTQAHRVQKYLSKDR
ncbi:unnamed protein product [Diatraea saccharalis]|uniref:Chitooligosaccharidolytic beta-N-acetylglucosaminidase n=1 Tax=Diatraea saccharalis TaxID=40085 RepID=A0A9N9RC95_9NEOP|nr:unnamed protein product [Diatraea saccharalis]